VSSFPAHPRTIGLTEIVRSAVQAGIRAFIVDNAPAHQQESANAWASRVTGIGNILGYISGYLDLPKILPFFGNTQFKVLCVIASLSLGSTLLVSCLSITERDPRLEGPPLKDDPGVISFFIQVFKSIRQLSPQIRRVCEIQFCAWVGWFPFLFYSTTYIGQLYVNPIFEKHPNLSDEDIDAAWEAATRVGTFALLAYAITSFIASVLLPLLVVPSYRPVISQDAEGSGPASPFLTRRPSTSTLSFTASTGPALPPDNEPMPSFAKPTLLSRLQIPGLTLRRVWFLAHLLFSLCMFSTFFIYTPRVALLLLLLSVYLGL
jgi:solute carrier family 45 protein 1/2/4